MPYKSQAQSRAMHAKAPAVAAKWDKKYGPAPKTKPKTKKKK